MRLINPRLDRGLIPTPHAPTPMRAGVRMILREHLAEQRDRYADDADGRARARGWYPAAMSERETESLPFDPAMLERLRRGFPLHMDRQGNFSFEGDPITHPGIVRLFRTSLDATETGEVTLGLEGKWVYLKLDDLPLRALRVDEPRADEHGPQLLLDDERRVALDPASLVEDEGGGLRCTVPARTSGRALGVRLSNTAAVDLSRWFVWADEDARPVLEIDGQRFVIPEA